MVAPMITDRIAIETIDYPTFFAELSSAVNPEDGATYWMVIVDFASASRDASSIELTFDSPVVARGFLSSLKSALRIDPA